ncbi:sodium:proton antiporter NhaD [Flectobacillus longus]|uniref:sodium:proton antiporter NhaD n=1 Tax=Flectobacillus longus TaxID=2984207 RepID=UPI0024B6B49A|nr:sodium:proton antiporter NhaD [Flectobacillus longus]MDI9881998.1 sodium:proton antiporter NhaD [Flectobacillus longus]
MTTLMILIFVIGYLAITLEHNIHINKTATALLTGVLCWAVYALSASDIHIVSEQLSHHLGDIAEIVFFLLGAMTIVELVDAHDGFAIITQKIKTQDIKTLMWLVAILTFFMSAVLDNLTTAIVMVSLLRKILVSGETRKIMVGLVVIAANAGGAWSPLGDVTTTMLWIGKQVSAMGVISQLLIPSMVSLIVPLIYLHFTLKSKGNVFSTKLENTMSLPNTERNLMFAVGLGALLFVPIFKTVTHLPPYMGMLMGLGAVWLVSELIHKDKDEETKSKYSAVHALRKIDTPSILFFLGILVAIAALESTEQLHHFAEWMNHTLGNQDLIVFIIGIASAVIDNVPLVAASMGMYDLQTFPTDSKLWEFMAYCAGTGGSMLIIGSAAGVAVMGMEKIDFMWYFKKISFVALLGYVAGAAVYLALYSFTH